MTPNNGLLSKQDVTDICWCRRSTTATTRISCGQWNIGVGFTFRCWVVLRCTVCKQAFNLLVAGLQTILHEQHNNIQLSVLPAAQLAWNSVLMLNILTSWKVKCLSVKSRITYEIYAITADPAKSHFWREAQLSQRGRTTLRVIEYFAKSLKVTECHSKCKSILVFRRNSICISYHFWDI